MKDSIYLLATALVCAALAAAFWNYFGDDAFWILTSVFVVGLAVDNVKLRRELRQWRSGQKP